MYQIKKDRLPELFAAMAGAQDLFLPIRKADQTNYGLWTEEVQVDLEEALAAPVEEGQEIGRMTVTPADRR